MNSFSFFLSGKLFICPSVQNNSIAVQCNLVCRSSLYITLYIFHQSLWARKVSVEKSANSLMGPSSQITNCFSLVAFKILTLSLIFDIFILMCLGVGLFGLILFWTVCASWTYMSIFLTRLGKFSVIIFSNRFSISCSLSPPFCTPMMHMLVHLK